MREVNRVMFFVFKLVRTIEGFFSRRLERYFLAKGFRRNRVVSSICGLRHFFYFTIYNMFKPEGIVLVNIQGSNMFVNPDDRGIAPMLLMDGVIEQYETKLFKKTIKKGMVVVDIGANIGYYSLIAASLTGDNGIVYAFEPEPTTYALLCKNIDVNNYTNIVAIQKAVSNQQGNAEFWVDKAGIAISSFSKDNVMAFSNAPLVGLSEDPISVKLETVALDEFFENLSNKIDFIKIDTQGAEGLIIEGAEKILRGNDNIKIIMEFWPWGLRSLEADPLELLHKLQKYGFKIKLINERKQTLETIEPVEFCRVIDQKFGHQEFDLLLEK